MRLPAKTVPQAEKRALEGDNDSQDSLQLFKAHMEIFGVGIRSSSPAPGELHQITNNINKSDRQQQRDGQRAHESSSNNQLNKKSLRNSRSGGRTSANTRNARDVSEIDDAHPQGLELVSTRAKDHDRDAQSRAATGSGILVDECAERAPRTKKMDSSQSPTQSNHGRSYDQYEDTAPSSPRRALRDEEALIPPSSPRLPTPQGNSIAEPEVPDHVGNTAGTDRTTSSLHDESPLVNLEGFGRPRNRVSQPHALPIPQFPETPAAPSNPFRSTRSQLLPPSELFGATQFSSALKVASPTSSRPSPDDFPHNSISPNVISSPLKSRGLRSTPFPISSPKSSPQILPGTTSPREHNGPSSPVHPNSAKDPVIPESSHGKRSVPEPMTVYETIHKSQERRSASEARSVSAGFDDDDGDDSIVRRRKAKSKKEAALKQLTAINFVPPPKADNVEVPSTNRRRARNRGSTSLAALASHGHSDATDTVADSQEQPVKRVQRNLPVDQESTQSDLEDNSAENDDQVSIKLHDLLQPPEKMVTERDKPVVTLEPGHRDAIPEHGLTKNQFGARKGNRMSPPAVPSVKNHTTPAFRSSPPAFSTRPRKADTISPSAVAGSEASGLTSLKSTPQFPSDITPGTEDSTLAGNLSVGKRVPNSSPAVAKSKRRRALDGLSNLKSASTENMRQSTRSASRYSNSTDELTRSRSSTPTFEQSHYVSRASTSKASRSMAKPQQNQRSAGLFEGMAFAISFQAKKPGESSDQYNTRLEFSSTIEKRIKQAGGRILHNGFDELFEAFPVKTGPVSPVPGSRAESDIVLTPLGKNTGFTALIADGHSRKVKYMQALALGLPCIASRWITSCLEKSNLVDWTPYLLCAGQSAFLGDAIRSRNLTPYDAETARLTEIVDRRPKLLEGSKILLVVKKSVESKKMAYVFLARVLGAAMSRVYSIEEAKIEMKAAEESGEPFDWVYVDGKADKVGLFSTAPPGDKKKRKRASTAAVPPELPAKKIRTLSDELVIQSLILGRLIEEGEMEN